MASTLRLPPGLESRLAARAAREGASKSAIVQRLVNEHVDDDIRGNTHDAAVTAAIAHITTRWSDVLDRLGNS